MGNQEEGIDSKLKSSYKHQRHHIKELEREHNLAQESILSLTSHLGRIQLRVAQIGRSVPWQRERLLRELEEIAFSSASDMHSNETPEIFLDLNSLINLRRKETDLFQRLRSQLKHFTCESQTSVARQPKQ